MITCSEAVRQLWEYLDDEVRPVDRRALEEHLSRCLRCCAELEFAGELRRFLADSAEREIPGDVLARLDATLDRLEDR